MKALNICYYHQVLRNLF